MLPKTIERIEQAKSLIDDGMTVSKAIKQVGLGSATWYEFKKLNPTSRTITQTPTTKRKYTKRKAKPFVQEIPAHHLETTKLAYLLIGDIDTLTQIIKSGLK